MKKILLITTGGTIASVQTANGLAPEIGSRELLCFVPELLQRYEIDVLSLMNIESPDLTPNLWSDMTEAVRSRYEDYDGFVITHGTDTLAYTASALYYTIRGGDKTVVITGSQYPVGDAVTDAKRNLIDSCRFAADSGMLGVFTVFAGAVMYGVRTKKLRSMAFEAFESVNYPNAACIRCDGAVIPLCVPTGPRAPAAFYFGFDSRVQLIRMFPGVRPSDCARLPDGCRAVILDAYGVAGIPRSFLPLIQAWSEDGKIILITSQAVWDGTSVGSYTVGCEATREYPLLESLDMTSEAAIVKLMFALGQSGDPDRVRALFEQPVGCDRMKL